MPTNKYAEGYPGRRYYGGCEVVDEIEQLAIDRAKELFGAEHANVQPHAGAQTNMAVYFAALQPGRHDPRDAARPRRAPDARAQGQLLRAALRRSRTYGVERESGLIDFDEVRRIAEEHRPKLIVCGASAYPRTIEAERFREIADEVGALLLCDMAHFAGLVAAGLHPNPTPHCDFVTSTAHKTLAGPRSGFVLCKEEHAQALDKAVFPGMQGGPLMHTIAAKATCFKIAASEAFRDYQRQVRANADALAATLTEGGLDLLTGGTDTHLVQIDLRRSEWTGKDAEERLARGATSPRTATRCRSTSGRRRSRRGSGSGRLPRRCAASTRTTSARSARSSSTRSRRTPTSTRSRTRATRSASKHPLYPGFRGYVSFAP